MKIQPDMLVIHPGDALVVVDVQNDFLPGGSLAVPGGDQVIAPLNRAIRAFRSHGLPIFATRDWHPANHCSFIGEGGPWPAHCVQKTAGAELPSGLNWREADLRLIDKATNPEREALSGFEGTSLHESFKLHGVSRIFVGGLTTDFCVLETVRDAVRLGYQVVLLTDAVRALNAKEGGERAALDEMGKLGVGFARSDSM